MAARPGRPPLPDFSDPLAPTCWRRRSGCGAPAGRGGHHHQVLTLRACSIFPASGGAGQAGVVLDLLQAFAWARCCTLVRSRSTRCCCYRPAPAARIRLWSSCRARWPPPGADAARVLDLPPPYGAAGQAGAVLELQQAFARARCWIINMGEVVTRRIVQNVINDQQVPEPSAWANLSTRLSTVPVDIC